MDHIEQAHDVADPAADDGQRGARRAGEAAAFDLQEGKCDGGEYDVMHPARICATFEVIETEVVLRRAVIVVLAGGSKHTQTADIGAALQLARGLSE